MFLRRTIFGTNVVANACVLAVGSLSLTWAADARAQTGAVVEARPAVESVQAPVNVGKPWHKYLTEQGFLAAKLIAVADDYQGAGVPVPMDVSVYKASNKVLVARTGPGGVAQLNAVREGSHGLVAMGPNGVTAVGFYLAAGSGGGVMAPQIAGYLAPAVDVPLIMRLITGGGGGATTIGQAVPDAELEGMRDPGPMSYYLEPDGSFVGRFVSVESAVAQASAGMKVSIIRRGEVLCESVTDERGLFKATNVSPGLITVVAVGPSGFSVFGASVAGNVVTGISADGETRFVALAASAPPAMAVAPPGAMAGFQQQMQTSFPGLGSAPPGSAPFGGGGGGFGGGSGGGGFGGGGGALGAALGAIGAGLGAAALADDDDKPVSPAGP